MNVSKLLTVLTLAFLIQGCTNQQHTYVGTLTGVKTFRGACNFGDVEMQPLNSGSSIISIPFQDMNQSKESLILKSLGKKIKIQVKATRFLLFCSSSIVHIEEL